MLFNSYVFVFLFFPTVFLLYFFLNSKKKYELAKGAVVACSLFFYGYMTPSYVFILAGSTLLNYVASYFMVKGGEKTKKFLGFFAVVCNLGILFYFKYYDFFIENINYIFKQNYVLKNIALPLGISFYTFQQISYIVDRVKDKAEHYQLIDYMLYVSYFPQLIAGPIVRHNELIPQFGELSKKKINLSNIVKGIRIFTLGLAKKILIADELGKVVDAGYTSISLLDAPSAWIVMLCYTFQIFFDFSGYSDMAIGMGKIMNIDLPRNFDRPYISASVKEFWNRWHMTLNSFFTEYVYIPLGGGYGSKLKKIRNTMVVFLLSGIWHGADWTFIVWGIINGLCISFENIVPYEKINKKIRMVVTFVFTNFAWVLFRSSSIAETRLLYQKLFAFGNDTYIFTLLKSLSGFKTYIAEQIMTIYKPGWTNYFFLVYILVLLVLCIYFGLCQDTVRWVENHKPKAIYMVVSAIIMCMCVISFSEVTTFLYFNF